MQFAQASIATRLRIGDPFYLVMAVILTAIVVFGFSHTVPFDLAPPGLPWLLVVHAGVFGGWMLVALVQPALIMRGTPGLHRRLGWVGVGLAVAMVVMGAGAILFALRSDSVPPFYSHGLFITRGTAGLLVFGGLVTGAVVLRKRAQWHKRLMLCASIAVVAPGLERAFPFFLIGPRWPLAVDGLIDLLVLAGPIVDLVQRGRIHPAYRWGGGVVVAGQVVSYGLAPTPVATAMLRALNLH
jgi:hypothetical protein